MPILPAPAMPKASGKSGREHWQPDAEVTHCSACQAEFGMLLRKHHCRACGKIFCAACSDREISYTPETRRHEEGYTEKAKRVCGDCFGRITTERKEAALLEEAAAIAGAAPPAAARAQPPAPKRSSLKKTPAQQCAELQPQLQGHEDAEGAPGSGAKRDSDSADGNDGPECDAAVKAHAERRRARRERGPLNRVKFQSEPAMRAVPERDPLPRSGSWHGSLRDPAPRAGSWHGSAHPAGTKIPARITSMYMRL